MGEIDDPQFYCFPVRIGDPHPLVWKIPIWLHFSIVFLLRVSLTSIKILTRYMTWPVFLFTKSLTLPSLDTGHCCCCDKNSYHAVVREDVAPLANPHATRRAGCQPLKCCWVLSPSPVALLSLSLPLHLLLTTRSLKQSNMKSPGYILNLDVQKASSFSKIQRNTVCFHSFQSLWTIRSKGWRSGPRAKHGTRIQFVGQVRSPSLSSRQRSLAHLLVDHLITTLLPMF